MGKNSKIVPVQFVNSGKYGIIIFWKLLSYNDIIRLQADYTRGLSIDSPLFFIIKKISTISATYRCKIIKKVFYVFISLHIENPSAAPQGDTGRQTYENDYL